MSRDSRKLLTMLEDLAKQNNITTIVTLGEIYQCDQLMLKYYISPVENVIRTKLRSIGKKSSKHFTVHYWTTIIETTFSNNYSVQREGNDVGKIDDKMPTSFEWINKYILTDYSDFDAKSLHQIVRTYNEDMILKAIKVGKDNKVYNIPYIKAVLEREQAMTNMKKQEMERLADKAESASSILDRQKVENSISDVASASYNWDKAKEDAELMAKFNQMFGGE